MEARVGVRVRIMARISVEPGCGHEARGRVRASFEPGWDVKLELGTNICLHIIVTIAMYYRYSTVLYILYRCAVLI